MVLNYPNEKRIVCDRRYATKDGWVSGFELQPVVETANIALTATGKSISVNDYHEELGHPSMATTRKTAKSRGVNLKGTAQICKECVKSKAKQKNVPKSQVPRSTIPGERLFIDISSPSQSL